MENIYKPEDFVTALFDRIDQKAKGRLSELGYCRYYAAEGDELIVQVMKTAPVPLEIAESFKNMVVTSEDLKRVKKTFNDSRIEFEDMWMFDGKLRASSYQCIASSDEYLNGFEKNYINTLKIDGLSLSEDLLTTIVDNII